MGWFSFFERKEEPAFCRAEFATLFSSFIDSFVDSLNASGPAVACELEPNTPPERIEHVLPPAKRLVAIGDIHGDVRKLWAALRAAKLVDSDHRWSGGDTVAVQVGDQLDRGDDELPVLYALERLQREAARAGGAVHVINGNHETMNVGGNFRYATPGASASFARWFAHQMLGAKLKEKCRCQRGWSDVPELETGPLGSQKPRQEAQACRWAALQPGGLVTRRFMARHPTILQVGSTVFVHGGLHPDHLEVGIKEINERTQDWMFGSGSQRKEPRFLRGANAVVWSREYSATDASKCNCDMLRETLSRVGASRMVVGHTIQHDGVNSACGDLVVRVDVGMSYGCGDHVPEVLEIIDDKHLFRIMADGTRVPVGTAEEQRPLWRKAADAIAKNAAQAA